MIEVSQVADEREKERFLTFPWVLYRHDPLWVPPIYSERKKTTDPKRGMFFRKGYADFFIAYRDGVVAGTLCCSHEEGGDPEECSLGFFECVDDLEVAAGLFDAAESWARGHQLTRMRGTYNLDREDGRGILLEGLDRPPVVLCGHNPLYYSGLFEKNGFGKYRDDGLAYAIALDASTGPMRRLYRLAEQVKKRRNFVIRSARLEQLQDEIDRVLVLQNRSLMHLGGPAYTRESIEAMVMPLKDLADMDLVLFVESNGQSVGWFPAVPNVNEILIRLGGLRRPWDYINALRFRHMHPRCLAVKSAAVLPEFWDTGAAVLLFAEMVQRAIVRGYKWLDLSLTGEDNPDTWDIAHHMGAHIYKRYRFFEKSVEKEAQ